MKILFVCNQGKDRSPTCAKVWNTLFEENKSQNDETEFMGIYNESHNPEKMIKWSELIIVMEEHHRKWIADNHPKEYLKKKILCMDLPDTYYFMQPELIEILKKKFGRIKTQLWADKLPMDKNKKKKYEKLANFAREDPKGYQTATEEYIEMLGEPENKDSREGVE